MYSDLLIQRFSLARDSSGDAVFVRAYEPFVSATGELKLEPLEPLQSEQYCGG